MYLDRKSKKGLALSIELVAVVTVIIGIVSLTSVISMSGYKSYRVTQISKQISYLQVAINEFKTSVGYYPGDVNYSDLAGDLNSPTLKANHTTIITLSAPTTQNDLFISPRTENVGIAKSQLAFSQLAKYGLIEFKNAENRTLTSSCDGVSALTNQVFPRIEGTSRSVWMFITDTVNLTNFNVPKNSLVYNSIFYPNFKGKPRLVAVSSDITNCTIDIQNDIGAIASDIAYALDKKMDDAKPSKATGTIIADAKNNLGLCKTLTVGVGSPTVQDYDYTENTSTSSNDACVLTVKL